MTPDQELREAEEAVAKEIGWIGIPYPSRNTYFQAAVRRELKLRAYERAVERMKKERLTSALTILEMENAI